MTQAVLTRLGRGEDAATAFVTKPTDADAAARAVCAMLNAGHSGMVFVGVSADGRPHGHADDEGSAALEVDLKVRISPPALFSASIERVGNNSFIVIDVPAAKDQPYVFDGAVWLRVGSDSIRADAAEMRALLQRHVDEPVRWERRISPGMSEEDLAEEEVQVTQEEAGTLDRFSFNVTPQDRLPLLRKLFLERADGFSQACDALFARNPEQRHPQTRVQLIRFTHNKLDNAYEDYRWFEGPIVRVAREVLEVLSSMNARRANFSETSAKREDRFDYPAYALREGLVNALVHRDYSDYSGGVRISVFPKRIEFWNSGRLPKEIKVADLARRHPSLPVNPDMAHVFYLRGLMERTGRGAELIAARCKEAGAPAPQWHDQSSGVTLVLHAASSAGGAALEDLNPRQRAYLTQTEPGSAITPNAYLAEFGGGITDRHARRDLSQLEGFGFVRRQGAGPATSYLRLAR